MTESPQIELRLLGRCLVLRDGAEIPATEFGGRKVRALLRVLATRRPGFVSHDALTEMLWGDRPPADPAANLQVLVNRARRALQRPELVITGPRGYALAGGDEWIVDAEQFLAAVDQARREHGRDRLKAYEDALQRWGGEPLAEDRYAEWAAEFRDRLIRARQQLLEESAELALELGETARAVELAATAAAGEPLREAAVLTLIRSLAVSGDPAGALERYDLFRRALADELGVDPSDEAQALHAELLRGRRPPAAIASAQPIDAEFVALRFVGREAELAALHAASAHGARVTLIGPSGAGKSRLLELFATRTPVLTVRAFLAEQDEPWSLARSVFREILAADADAADRLPESMRAAIAWLLPEAELVLGSPPPDPESRRALLVEAGARMLTAAARPIVVDDLQWADATSLALLESVLARAGGIGAVLAARPGEREAVTRFLDRLPQVQHVRVGALDEAEIRTLVLDEALAAELAASTDATPMAIAEVLRGLGADGLIARTSAHSWRVVRSEAVARARQLARDGQRRAIEQRVAAQGRLAVDLLGLLSLAAREVAARLLAGAAAVPERDVLDALRQLATDGLVRLGERGWAPAHDMIGETITDTLAPDARGRLHGLLAHALADDEAEPGELAAHWLGAGDTGRAAQAYRTAAAHALDAFADREALSLAETGLGLTPSGEIAAALHEISADARGRLGDIGAARADLRAAMSVHQGGPARARLLGKLAVLASGADDLIRAAELAELSLVEAGSDPAARARALEIAAVLDMNLDRAARAETRAAEALAIYEQLGEAKGTARVLDARAMATFLDGDVARGVRELERAANLFEDSGDLVRVVTPRSTAGHGLVFAGDPTAGLACATSAVEIARTLGHPEGQAYALWHTTEALAALGRSEDAIAAGDEALAIARRIEHRGWTATAWRAIGIARQSSGDLDAALNAFEQSLANSEHLNLFSSWAAARCALVLIARGRLDAAAQLVERALGEGPPLGHFEARLAQVELAAARGDPAVVELARKALELAAAAGVKQGAERLAELAS